MKEYGEQGMDMSAVRDESEAVYVSSLAKFANDIEPGRYTKDWLWYCMMPWLYHTLPFLNGAKVRRNVK